jgi:RHS repeat-associated protein
VGSTGTVPLVGNSSSTVATSAIFNKPRAITPSKYQGGVYYIADTFNNVVRKINTISNQIEIYAGNGSSADSSASQHISGLNAKQVAIFRPNGLAEDSEGNLYISSENGYIRKVSQDGTIETIAGKEQLSNVALSSSFDTVNLKRPMGLALDEVNNLLYVADVDNNRIVALDMNIKRAFQIAGKGKTQCTSNDKNGASALELDLCKISQIDLDTDGNLLFVDHNLNMIRKVIIQNPRAEQVRFISSTDNGSSVIRKTDGTLERVYRSGARVLFNSNGKQVETIDRNNVHTFYDYNGSNQLTAIRFPDDTAMSFSYNGDLVDSITDPAGRTTYLNIIDGELQTVNFPGSISRSYIYDPETKQLVSETSEDGSTVTYKYNQWDFLESATHPNGDTIQMSYGISDTVGNDFVDGEVPIIESKVNNETGESELKDIYTNTKGVETEYVKDVNGQVIKIVKKYEQGDKITLIDRDDNGRMVKLTRDDGTYLELSYSDSLDLGFPKCVDIISNKHNERCSSDEFIDLIKRYDSKTAELEYYEYNQYGDLLYKEVSKDSELVGKFTLAYDEEGNLIEKVDAEGNKIFKSYYPNTGLLQYSGALLGNNEIYSTFEYDEHFNLKFRYMPSGVYESYFRDNAGNIEDKVDANGVKTSYVYDDHNRVLSLSRGIFDSTQSILENQELTSYSYTDSGRVKKVTNSYGDSIDMFYDVMGRLERRVLSDGKTLEIGYDKAGNVNFEKDFAGNERTLVYDDQDRIIEKYFNGQKTQSIDYDEFDNIKSIADDDSIINYTYEKHRNEYYIASSTVQYEGMADVSISYDYNGFGKRSILYTPFGNFQYSYDSVGKLTGLVNHKSEAFNFTYDSMNRLTRVDRPGSFSEAYYDNDNFLQAAVHKRLSDEKVVAQNNYGRDNAGNKFTIQSMWSAKTLKYDSLYNLLEVKDGVSEDNENLGVIERFSYDKIGNRTEDISKNYTYDSKKQSMTSDGIFVYIYDSNGNLERKGSISQGVSNYYSTYSYDHSNKLKTVKIYEGGALSRTISYKYDGIGRRFEKLIEDSNGARKTNWIYDGDEVLAEYRNGSVAAVYTNSSLTTDSILAIDVVSSDISNTLGSYYFLRDGTKSTSDVLDGNGNLVQHIEYSSFGEIKSILDGQGVNRTNDAPVKIAHLFTGREWDEDVQLYYYRARYYDPSIGRFTQLDSHPGMQLEPNTMFNRYAYVQNNPYNNIDPSGRFSISCCSKGLKVDTGIKVNIVNIKIDMSGLEDIELIHIKMSDEDLGAALVIAAGIVFAPATTIAVVGGYLLANPVEKGNWFEGAGKVISENRNEIGLSIAIGAISSEKELIAGKKSLLLKTLSESAGAYGSGLYKEGQQEKDSDKMFIGGFISLTNFAVSWKYL